MADKRHWNYRVVRHPPGVGGATEEWFALHEVFYGEDGEPIGITENPVSFGGDTPEEVAESLEMALRDARERPVLDRLAERPKVDDRG